MYVYYCVYVLWNIIVFMQVYIYIYSIARAHKCIYIYYIIYITSSSEHPVGVFTVPLLNTWGVILEHVPKGVERAPLFYDKCVPGFDL